MLWSIVFIFIFNSSCEYQVSFEFESLSGFHEGPLRADADHGEPCGVPAGAVGIPPRAAVTVHDGGGRGAGKGGYGDTGRNEIWMFNWRLKMRSPIVTPFGLGQSVAFGKRHYTQYGL